jgi:hypothetical protein
MHIGRACRDAAIVLGVVAGAALAQTPTQVFRGDVVSVGHGTLRVRASTGEDLAFALPDGVRVGVRAPASLEAIRPGVYVGTTATPRPDGTLVASEVHLFPESQRGVGEGHRPMATRPGSTMTNATVAAVAGGTMTNATVAGIAGRQRGRVLTLTYRGGEKTIVVPDDAAVVTLEPGSLSSLTPGTHVVVYATHKSDETLVAERIGAGTNGSVPPI